MGAGQDRWNRKHWTPRQARASDREDIIDNGSMIDAHHARHRWEVIVEPDPERLLLVVITAYPIE